VEGGGKKRGDERAELGGGGIALEIPGTDSLADVLAIEIFEEGREAGLGHLLDHGLLLDGPDLGVGGGLLRGWQCLDVIQDVGCFVDS
jgi:hypothetical protein